MTESFTQFVGFRLVLACAVGWVLIGPLVFGYVLVQLGWNTIGIELRWTLFVGFSLLIFSVLAGVLLGTAKLFGSIKNVR